MLGFSKIEHLIFRILKHEQNVYSHICMIHPEKKLIQFNTGSKHIVDTGRARWSIYGFSSWNSVPMGLIEEGKRFDPEFPKYNVILTPQKVHQVPFIIPPQKILTPDSKETGLWIFSGCLREEYYY